MLQSFLVQMIQMIVRDQDHVGTDRKESLVNGLAARILRLKILYVVGKIGIDDDLLSVRLKQKTCLAEIGDFHGASP